MLYTAAQILGKDRSEDAVHDVFIKIVDKYDENQQNFGDKPGQYFVIMVKNHSLNILKKEKLVLLPLEEEFLEGEVFQTSTPSPEDSLVEGEAIDRLVTLIQQLTPATRQVMEYRYIAGYTNIEIADLLGVSQSAVSTRIDKAKKKLREILESEEVSGNEHR